jgi:hypothetical protein
MTDGKNPQAALNPGPFGEGDRVRMLWGVTSVEGIVIEDRGNLDVSEPMETEEPAEDLTLVAKGPTKLRNVRRGQCPRANPGEGNDVTWTHTPTRPAGNAGP